MNLTKNGSEYIYLKQLEEADYLLVNKSDILSDEDKLKLKKLLSSRFSEYPIYWISALNKTRIQDWFDSLLVDNNIGHRIADVDYDIYAKGEALMGWYNATFLVEHIEGNLLPWEELNIKFLQLLQQIFNHEKIIIGHIKTFLKDNYSYLKGNIINQNQKVNLLGTPFRSTTSTLILNIRAETSSGNIKDIVDDIIKSYLEYNIKFKIVTINHLTPKKPVPTHKMDLTLKQVN